MGLRDAPTPVIGVVSSEIDNMLLRLPSCGRATRMNRDSSRILAALLLRFPRRGGECNAFVRALYRLLTFF